MGKLVLGIIAVTLLQIAFFVYMATDRPSYTKAGPPRTGPVAKTPELSRASGAPEVGTPPSLATPAASDREPPKVNMPSVTKRSLASVRARAIIRDRDRAARPPARVVAMAPATSVRSSREWDASPRRSGRLIPSGYTMALVDYPPAPARINTPVVTSSKLSASASIRTKEISEPKKRSFIAKAVPALVKKPWNWIKSLASKLD